MVNLGKTAEVNPVHPEGDIIERAVSLIKQGEIIICPTDTCYILAVNALDALAIQKVFQLKRRSYRKPIHVVVDGLGAMRKVAFVNTAARVLTRQFLPGPLTLILKRRNIIPSLLVAGLSTVGIRIPNNLVVLSLAKEGGVPLTATSANVSGAPVCYNTSDIIKQFGDQMKGISLIVDQGPLPSVKPSTIIDLTYTPPKVLREGPIAGSLLLKVVKQFSVKE